MLKKVIKCISAAVAGCLLFGAVSSAKNYSGHWAERYIDRAIANGVMSDRNNTRPDDNVTRAEFVSMIVRDKGITLGAYPTAFYDVDENDWYFRYIAAAENKGIILGDESFNFNPEEYITRQDAAVILGRAYGVPAQIGFDLTKHRDGIYISQYALGYMTYMTNCGIIGGFEDGSVRPLENVTRAQTVAMIDRIKNPVHIETETPKNEKITFKRGYPSIDDTGASGGFNMSFRTDVECDIYYTTVPVGTKVDEKDINNYMCHVNADEPMKSFFAYEQAEVDVYVIAIGDDGRKSAVKSFKNVMPLCFDRGSGTAKDPYIITNQQQLEAISRYPKKFFALGASIRLDGNFTPIGSAYTKEKMFSGGFDGRGYTISNLSIKTDEKFVGLFSYLDGASVKNLYVNAKTISGMNDVGIIAGENNGGQIENCFVTGVVEAKNNNAGGIVGTNNGRVIDSASAAAIVQSSMYSGGISGINFGIIKNCASYAHTIMAQMYAGGISSLNNGGSVSSCLAANMNIETVILANSGRIATNLAGGVLENNYCYDKTHAYVADAYNEVGTQNGADASWDMLFDDEFYFDKLNWDMVNLWEKADNDDVLMLPTPIGLGGGYDIEGLTEFTPIHVDSEEKLMLLHDNPQMNYILTSDIELNYPWQTVCADEQFGFSGTFNGNGYAIKNLKQNYDENQQYYGFIGVLDGGILRNVKITGADIFGGRYTGGICAVNKGIITGAYFDGNISVHDASSVVSAGGICALNYNTIENAGVQSDIKAFANSSEVGGIAAHNEGKISDAYMLGTIGTTGMKAISNCTLGGIAGYNGDGVIYNAFSSLTAATLSDTVYAGGICGMFDTGEIYKSSSIFNTHIYDAEGSDTKAYIGGISGISNGGSISNSLSSGKLEGTHDKSYVGGISGYNVSALVQNTYSTASITQSGAKSVSGGIVGYNESGYVMYNAALNTSIRSEGTVSRVCGKSDGGSVETNYAVTEMMVNYSQAGDSMLNGLGKPSSQMKSEFFFKPVYEGGALGWSSVKYDGAENGVWAGAIENGGYYNLPLLNGVYGQHMFTAPIYNIK